ncbi:PREDICTED: disease resistance [Prunus dulcis]|nr:probable disease resistance protein At4g27220 [Prunus dulcis]KAI5311773.1 hypothetical protein L3X38_040946 [Prunus dulcis]VVA16151.1 PREDICTED: disease resistance [Prunus dulcis]
MSFGVTAAAQAVGNTVEPATICCTWIFNCLKRKYDDVKNLGRNYKKLEDEEKDLIDRERDVNEEIAGRASIMRTKNECETWLHRVGERKVAINALKTRYQSINPCLGGLCPFPSLLRLSRDIAKETKAIAILKDKMRSKDSIMALTAPASQYRSIKRHAQNIDDCPSLGKHVEEIIELLEVNECKQICVWGSSGVGKTTVMENVHDRVSETDQFEMIFWVTMTTNGREDEIQQVLEERLGLLVEENASNEIRAANISNKLQNKNYLLFLDQVSLKPDLKKVGIHHDHWGKVVFARDDRDNSDTYDDIRIRRLSDDDAQKLFDRTVRADVMKNRVIARIAKSIVRECGGMPQLIKLTARQLETRDPTLWQHKLDQMQAPSEQQHQELEEFYRGFKPVYDKLDKSKQPCLLYWAVFPFGDEIHRDYIIECWRAEQFFTGFPKLGKTRDRGHAILDEFEKKCIVDRGRKGFHYKMPQNFQRVALRMANGNRENHQLLVRKGEMSTEEEWKHVQRVLLNHHPDSTLPVQPQCLEILTLLLQNRSLTSIPKLFFESMRTLQVLDLHETGIGSLPSSISALRKLKGLYLTGCDELKELPAEIGKLESLEILDINRTGIRNLPTEIQQLTNLKCLRVSFGAQSTTILPPGTISKLIQLEELSIVINHNVKTWNNVVDGIVKEIVRLKELTTLHFYFPTVDCLDVFISRSESWKRQNTMGSGFRSFNIVVGYHQTNRVIGIDISRCSSEKHLRFFAGDSIPDAILQILKHAITFELIDHQNLIDLSIFGDNLRGLEICKIERCNQMESIIDGDKVGGVAFQCLEQLHIINIPNLVYTWKGSMTTQSLSSLATLLLKGCPRLEILFSKAMVQLLSQLQHLEVEDCQEMKVIIETGSNVLRAFPKLKTIKLSNLPKLATIWQGALMEWPSLRTIEIRGCAMLKDLPSTMEKAAKLKVIRCTRDWMNHLEWPSDPAVEARFQTMFHFV